MPINIMYITYILYLLISYYPLATEKYYCFIYFLCESPGSTTYDEMTIHLLK